MTTLGIEAQHPDEFVVCQIGLDRPTVVRALHEQRCRLLRPAVGVEAFLATLERSIPRSVALLRDHSSDL